LASDGLVNCLLILRQPKWQHRAFFVVGFLRCVGWVDRNSRARTKKALTVPISFHCSSQRAEREVCGFLVLCANMDQVIGVVKNLQREPTVFLLPTDDMVKKIKNTTKALSSLTQGFDFTRKVPELAIEGFDEEQIWEQINYRNNIWDSSITDTLKTLVESVDNCFK
jgi:hypothetical protein